MKLKSKQKTKSKQISYAPPIAHFPTNSAFSEFFDSQNSLIFIIFVYPIGAATKIWFVDLFLTHFTNSHKQNQSCYLNYKRTEGAGEELDSPSEKNAHFSGFPEELIIIFPFILFIFHSYSLAFLKSFSKLFCRGKISELKMFFISSYHVVLSTMSSNLTK